MNKLQILGISLGAFSIAGCQSFPMHLGLQNRQDVSAPDMSSYFAQLLNEGERHLRANRPGTAITAFRQASYHPDYAGAAYNGLAISYDRMGRFDLAQRFFQAAIDAAPEDPRFARNAARFERQMLARNENLPAIQFAQVRDDVAAIARSGDAQPGGTIGNSAEQLPQRMERISANEVRLAGREDWGARLASADTLPAAVVHIGAAGPEGERRAGSAPPRPIRLAHSGRSADGTDSPRITHLIDRSGLGSARRAAGVRESVSAPEHGSDYPISIDIETVAIGSEAIRSASAFADRRGSVSVRVSGQLLPRRAANYPITIELNPS